MSSEDKKPLEKDEFYVVVDGFTDHPETGELMLNQPVFRTKFLAVNQPAYTDKGGVAHTPLKVIIEPDALNGIYYVQVAGGYSREKSEIMKFQQKRYPNMILGPFDTQNEALVAKHEARPKTKNEKIGQLADANQQKDAEILALRERLTKLETKSAPKGAASKDK